MDKRLSVNHKCHICGSMEDCKTVAPINKNYSVIKCNNCKIAFLYPMPSTQELVEYYKNYHITKISKTNDHGDPSLIEKHQRIIDYLISKMDTEAKATFLDYGFGSGAFLKQAAKDGFSVSGIEFNDRNCKQLEEYCQQNNLKIQTINITKEPLEKLSGRPFNCITLFSIIEHVLDPLKLMISLSSQQKQGGFLYIECPNNDAAYLKIKNMIKKRIGREDFFDSLNPPQHIYGFNRYSLNILLRKAGYVPIEIKDFFFGDGMHQVENVLWYPSLSDILNDKESWNLYRISMFALRLFDFLASRVLGAGGGLYALAYKR